MGTTVTCKLLLLLLFFNMYRIMYPLGPGVKYYYFCPKRRLINRQFVKGYKRLVSLTDTSNILSMQLGIALCQVGTTLLVIMTSVRLNYLLT